VEAQALGTDLWQHGPEFLRQTEENWPELDLLPDLAEDDAEVKSSGKRGGQAAVNAAIVTPKGEAEGPLEFLMARNSSWERLLRVTARLLSIKDKWRRGVPMPKVMEPAHLRAAEVALCKQQQGRYFARELRAAQAGKPIPEDSPLRELRPVADNGLLRIGSRLGQSDVHIDAQAPIILPQESPLSTILVWHHHYKTAHGGQGRVHAELERSHRILKVKPLINKLLSNCVPCRAREARPCEQAMAQLPGERVRGGEPAFSYVGVDCFGPFKVKQGRARVKRYGCLFTCLTVRAIHIEVLHTLETSSFLDALHRFIARRGTPRILRSDNGTNFVGAERELRESLERLDQEKIRGIIATEGIRWVFNPPAASHMGGVWERQIRTVRRVLAGLAPEEDLTDEGLRTLFCSVESIINSRPISSHSADPADPEPLTPNHLLLQRAFPIPPGVYSDADRYSRRRWRQVQYLADIFWERWRKEYLPQLRAATKWQGPRRNVAEGDLVLIIEPPLARNQWRWGRVVAVHPGEDNLVRTVTLKTKDGELVRPIAKLCMLEEATVPDSE